MRAVLLMLAVSLLAAITVIGAPIAQAHDQLVSSSPAADAVLTEAPDQVELVYTEEIVDLGVVVEVIDWRGEDWVDGGPQVAGTAVTVPLRDGMVEGAYELRWRVVSSDGHPIDGTSAFTLTHADENETTSPSPREETAVPTSASPAQEPSVSPSPTGVASDDVPAGTLWGVAGALLLALAVVTVFMVVVRRRKDRPSGRELHDS